jgi:hypothetical protein
LLSLGNSDGWGNYAQPLLMEIGLKPKTKVIMVLGFSKQAMLVSMNISTKQTVRNGFLRILLLD